MTHEQANALNARFPSFHDDGGSLVVDGAHIDNATDAAIALSCLDTAAAQQFLDDLGTVAIMLYCLVHIPTCYKPEDIPSKDSRPTFYVTCSSGGHSHVYFKWE